jgi:hypothetical protein
MTDTATNANKFALFFALQNKIIHAEMGDRSVYEKVGTTLPLSALSLSERKRTHAECNAGDLEEKRQYKIVGLRVFHGDGEFAGDDGIDRVLKDRPWLEGLAFENGDFFDWYYAANILGIVCQPREYFPLSGAIIVELE